VIYTTGAVANNRDWGSWALKNSRTSDSLLQNGLDGYEIMPQIKPEPNELVLRKMKPSAFYGTPLLSYLHQSQIDTLLVAGTTTSGCVRATVVDGFSLNYRMTVIEDCVFDRFEASHAMNLFDMHAKYADVVGSEAAISYFGGLSDSVFGSPEKLTAAE
jgi:nicotinamidase-related amidase